MKPATDRLLCILKRRKKTKRVSRITRQKRFQAHLRSYITSEIVSIDTVT